MSTFPEGPLPVPKFDPFALDVDAPDWLEQITVRLLEVGVPPTAISKAFYVDLDAVKAVQDTLHVKKFGSAELSEAIMFFMWAMIEDAYTVMREAPIATRTRFITTMLARASSIVSKQEPEGLERMRDELMKLTGTIRTNASVVPSIYADPEYSPMEAGHDDD